jgi:hypothetical protein
MWMRSAIAGERAGFSGAWPILVLIPVRGWLHRLQAPGAMALGLVVIEASDQRRDEASKKHGSCPLGIQSHRIGSLFGCPIFARRSRSGPAKTNRSMPILMRCSIQQVRVAVHNEMEWRLYHGGMPAFSDPYLII